MSPVKHSIDLGHHIQFQDARILLAMRTGHMECIIREATERSRSIPIT
jgi:hypothetical protein